VSQHKLTSSEIRFLKDSLNADYKTVNIRLREGEYQYSLAKVIATFQLELYFPDVKDIIKRLYGEEKVANIQFIRKVQTILKKMEKSNLLQILPKKRPWDLQRYALSSFKFQDADKNLIVFATESEIKQTQNRLQSKLFTQEKPIAKIFNVKVKIFSLCILLVLSYLTILWNLMQSVINPVIFILAFSLAVFCSLFLGKVLSQA